MTPVQFNILTLMFAALLAQKYSDASAMVLWTIAFLSALNSGNFLGENNDKQST